MFLARRSGKKPDPWLEWKVRAFFVGAALGLAGIVLEEDWLVGGAVAVLFAGVLLRFLPADPGKGEERAASEGPAPSEDG